MTAATTSSSLSVIADYEVKTLGKFSCKRRGFCPSCGAGRMAHTAAHLVDHVIPHVPVRRFNRSFSWQADAFCEADIDEYFAPTRNPARSRQASPAAATCRAT